MRVVRAVLEAGYDDQHQFGYWDELRNKGWVTSGRISAFLKSESFATRKTLRRLADLGYLDQAYREHTEFFISNARGELAISNPPLPPKVDQISSLNDIDIFEIKKLLGKIEDISETIVDNQTRAQIVGFVRLVDVLVDLPDPPKAGLLALIRDPAFANIVQLGVFLTAIYVLVK